MHLRRSFTQRVLSLLLAAPLLLNAGIILPAASACSDPSALDIHCRCCASPAASEKAGSACCRKRAANQKRSGRTGCCRKTRQVDTGCHCRLHQQPRQPIPAKPGETTRRQLERLIAVQSSGGVGTFLPGAVTEACDFSSKLPAGSTSSIQTLLCVRLT